ncbi:potassium-transporting ATPase subunit KdpB [Acidithiobacillus caldus]|jgi:K+-transporting ATPase ATPase B chain|uniref:Potassium-transporting ATPase ATP-binding subunit n=3 Tax=Acidithiobacillus caldus TaxID=33059 RepID=F9ZTB9_ACICS|nr:potassium-transporting ATPase subunit KdpB [Acidithiobacillus caldus]AEK56937.1 Potassium-transporting ATPase B chain [Acidithiobacillus caldus SM-1]AIA54205.1 Potassium-transporting ATPase B chain [Acidithiobacillus caldus ATCC 51756]AUW31735.1 potassium-transporting ATPase subunit KdpB [Acidithiobacillus caldus]MBU2728857.1 potassium-transporting ATPase subunit KdpB [Acidithiobacillus caldus]MBU2736909.1 potassium-transporting ATPase subunit KdpB [Acidithiobacillus caldus ATCC 51756]
MTTHHIHSARFSWRDLGRAAIRESFRKLDPRVQWRNPVMFVVYIGAILVTAIGIADLLHGRWSEAGFVWAVDFWLWLTVLFANFSEALAEGQGKAQAASLRQARHEVTAKKLREARHDAGWEEVAGASLQPGDYVLVEAGDTIPSDGEAVEGVASVDESAITGESAPVIREGGGDRSAVTGGTRVLSDWLVVRITSSPGETFLDRMIRMVEGAARRKTPNEIALAVLLVLLTIVFLVVTVTLYPFSYYSVHFANHSGTVISTTVLVALLVCLIPTTIGALLPAIGIAGIMRLLQANVVAKSGRAIEAAGDADVLFLDKTGTITFGNRQASAFYPAPGVTDQELASAARLSSLTDDTPEGKSIVLLAEQKYPSARESVGEDAKWIAFSAETRMSGVDASGKELRKGAPDAVKAWVLEKGGQWPAEIDQIVQKVAQSGATPLVVALDGRGLGVVELKDIVKPGIKERFAELRKMGIRTVMVTGDNPLTAGAIAAEAGVDDYLAEAKPETKLARIREYHQEGHMVAMTGDGTNDAPALAQADVAVCMASGTQAAREAANMVDLDSDPTKLLEIVRIGKQLLMTRGSLTTFSIANDVAKYFAIIPAAFVGTYPQVAALNIMDLSSPESAILSAVIFNAVVIPFLIPLALKGVAYRAVSAQALLRRNLLIYGLGGLIAPFIGIKLIDILLSLL